MYFSVIVPIYNSEQYLCECVDSVLNQSFTDFELILIDDGSTDRSGSICDDYESKDERIKVIHKKNGGQSTARNKGIDCAEGKYLVFLDSDDFISNMNFLKVLYEKSIDNTDIIVYRYLKYYSNHSSDCGIDMSKLDGMGKDELLKELVCRDAFFCSCWSKIVRSEIIKEHRIYFDESLSCEDMDWYFNVVLKAKTAMAIDEAFICYRQREGSVTSGGYKEKNLLDFITTIERWRSRFDGMKDESQKNLMLSALAKLYCNLLISFSRNYKQAKNNAPEVYKFKDLLKWDLNPRTKIFYKISSLVGIRGLCLGLRIVSIIRG